MTMLSNQARHVLKKLGGPVKVAKGIGVVPSTVYRWQYPLRKNKGQGGIIPNKYHEAIELYARLQGILLTSEDWRV